jgi:hypothetical protein
MSKKSSEIEEFLNQFAVSAFGRSRTGSLAGKICVTCGELAEEFKDKLSEKEYKISGMCQKCQDSIFDGGGCHD